VKIPNKIQQLKEDEAKKPQDSGKGQAKTWSKYEQVRMDYLCMWVTVINSVISSVAGTYYALTVGLKDPDDPFDSFEYFFVTMNIAYFLHDTILLLAMGHQPLEFLFHHVMAIMGFSFPFLYNRWSSFAVFGMFLAEVSGPFLSMRKILPWLDNVKGWVADANDITFMVVFLTARIWGQEFLFYNMGYSTVPLFYKLQGTGLWFVAYIWIWQIYHKTVSLFGKKLFPESWFWKLQLKMSIFTRKVKLFYWAYLLVVFVYTHRFVFDYHGVTSIPVIIMPYWAGL